MRSKIQTVTAIIGLIALALMFGVVAYAQPLALWAIVPLVGLRGSKESAEDLKKASKDLFDQFKVIQTDLQKEMQSTVSGAIDTLQKEKIDKLSSALDGIAAKMKENNEKINAIESAHKTQIEAMEKDFNQKLASFNPGGESKDAEVIKESARKAMQYLMRTGDLAGAKEMYEGEKTSFLISNNSFLVPTEIDQMVQEVLSQESGLLNAVNVVRSNTKDYVKIVNRRGATVSKAAEATVRAEGIPQTMSQVEFGEGELYSWFPVSTHALDDAGIDLEAELLGSVPIDFAETLDFDIISGDGTNTIYGLNYYTAALNPTWGQIKKIQAASASAITYQDLLNVIHGVKRRYRRNGSVLLSRTTLASLRSIQDTNGNLVFRPSFNEGQFQENLLGYPILESEEIDDIGASNKVLYFGDFNRGYILHMLRDLRMVRDPYTLPGFVKFYFWQRVRGAVADFNTLDVLVMGSGS